MLKFNIMFCDDNYTKIYLNHYKEKSGSKTLKYFEDTLYNHNFARGDKSYLVNVNEVVKYVDKKVAFWH